MVVIVFTSSVLGSDIFDSQIYDALMYFLSQGIMIHRTSIAADVWRTAAVHVEADPTLGSRVGLYDGNSGVSLRVQFPGLPSITRKNILGETVDADGWCHDWNEYGEPSTQLNTFFSLIFWISI